MLRYSEKPMHLGLLVLRLGTGFLLVVQGLPLVTGGPDVWRRVGQVMAAVGIGWGKEVWGFLIAAVEVVGGVCVALGLFTRFAALALLLTVGLFLAAHLRGGGEILDAGRLLLHATVFLALLLTGPGRLSMDWPLFSKGR